jgi:hypothetical protein
VQNSDDGHAIQDLAIHDHAEERGEGEDLGPDKLGIIGGLVLNGLELLGEIEMGGLVQDAFAGMVGYDLGEATCPVTRLFLQLPLGCLLE